MKKIPMSILLIVVLISWLVFVPSAVCSAENSREFAFFMPESLVSIEDQAFEGTAAKSIVLGRAVLSIGERAFARNFNLKEISIFENVHYIGDHAFEDVNDLTIYAECNSFAARWAEEHNIHFIQSRAEFSRVETLRKILERVPYFILLLCSPEPGRILRRRRKAEEYVRSMRPQDRNELYPINYKFP